MTTLCILSTILHTLFMLFRGRTYLMTHLVSIYIQRIASVTLLVSLAGRLHIRVLLHTHLKTRTGKF